MAWSESLRYENAKPEPAECPIKSIWVVWVRVRTLSIRLSSSWSLLLPLSVFQSSTKSRLVQYSLEAKRWNCLA